MIERREFLKNLTLAGSAAVLAPRAMYSQSADARIEILINEPIATIHKDVYGHFVEHLGGVVYDGIWVGEKSKIPNYNGIRKALVDNLKKLKPGVIRYPGG
ncbi:MAG TPA: twin-arginine translocation signal domain-containing protein, partial [Pyrinomonadaceae bacterium]|nr:twin-arginine translocation signal domain-containing protein [Pyrinomonadaceae bacterium]